jgi:hypothetical protein
MRRHFCVNAAIRSSVMDALAFAVVIALLSAVLAQICNDLRGVVVKVVRHISQGDLAAIQVLESDLSEWKTLQNNTSLCVANSCTLLN